MTIYDLLFSFYCLLFTINYELLTNIINYCDYFLLLLLLLPLLLLLITVIITISTITKLLLR